MKRLLKTVLPLILSAALMIICCTGVFASDLDRLLAESRSLEEYLHQLTVTMTTLSMKQEYIQSGIDDVNQKISENEVLLGQTQEACDKQYELMKKRIRYLYESGNTNYLEAILSSDSISDVLNKFEYIDNIVGYDREMLDKYTQLVESVENLQTKLNSMKTELEELKEEAVKNLSEASTASGLGTAQVMEYGVTQEEASKLVSEYISEYGEEIRSEIQQELDRKQEEDPDFNWLREDKETAPEPETTQPETTVQEPTAPAEPVSEEPDTTEPETTTQEQTTTPEPATPEPTTAPETTTPAPTTTQEQTTTPEPTTTQPPTTTQAPTTTQQETTTLPELKFDEPTTSEPETTTAQPQAQDNDNDDDYQDTDDGGGYISDVGYDDAYLIACLVSGEVGYSSYETQWAVADLIMNLVESPSWPGSVYGVLHCPGVFDAVNWEYIPGTSVPSYLYYVANGPMSSALSAAYDAMGNRGASHGYTSYCADWFYEQNPEIFEGVDGQIIGSEFFYNYY